MILKALSSFILRFTLNAKPAGREALDDDASRPNNAGRNLGSWRTAVRGKTRGLRALTTPQGST
jgi:hypothetical protein